MRIALVLSNDWELFGDGSGDYFEVQHDPLVNLLRVVDDHGAKITVMAEVGQQWAHLELGSEHEFAQKISFAWEKICEETIRRKHDVQLHLHPQWLSYKYDGYCFRIDAETWTVPGLGLTKLKQALSKGKDYLESLLRPIDPNYRCLAFRAGGFCIEPSSEVVPILRKVGIYCDSSIIKGFYRPQVYDFRAAHSNLLPWFSTNRDLKRKGSIHEGILEIPIYSEQKVTSAFLRHLFPRLAYYLPYGIVMSDLDSTWQKVRRNLAAQRYPDAGRFYQEKGLERKRSLRDKFISSQTIHLNYDELPPSIFVRCLRNALKQARAAALPSHWTIVPVVALGHVKACQNMDNLQRILEAVRTSFGDSIEFWTLQKSVEYCLGCFETSPKLPGSPLKLASELEGSTVE